ncbi:MAG: hypothetical protein IKX22_06900 [Prevotella sp.]|nr:hypothetical protein [Prevotella sp.]
MKKTIYVLTATLFTIMIVACQSKERKYVSLQEDYIELLEEITKSGSISVSDSKAKKCVALNDELEQLEKECDFSGRDKKEIRKEKRNNQRKIRRLERATKGTRIVDSDDEEDNDEEDDDE